MYSFQVSSELMKNQKQAQVLSNSSQLDALQTSDGQALFFSIGDDNILHLYPEEESAGTGWNPIDLTTELSDQLSGNTVSAKSFTVSQDTNGNITIAQVVYTTDSTIDDLFVLSSLSNDPAALWLKSPANRSWLHLPFDTPPLNQTVDIAYVHISPYQSVDFDDSPSLVAGIVEANSNIHNYLVTFDQPPSSSNHAWQSWETAENFDHELGTMQFGKPKGQAFSGLYELYGLKGQAGVGLTFTPGYSGSAGIPTKFTAPPGATAIATLPADSDGNTDLYVAADGDGTGTGAIYVFPADQSGSIKIIQSALIAGVSYFELHIAGSKLTLWGTNAQGTLFYSSCSSGNAYDPGCWSALVPIQENVTQVASLLNLQTQASELFVNTANSSLVFAPQTDPTAPLPPPESRFLKLTQDPITTQWRSQTLLLPSLDVNDVIEFYSYTTHIDVVDDNSQPLPNTNFTLTSTSPVSVYLNDVYTTLSNDSPLTVQSSLTGSVTIVQETQSLGAVAYNLVQGDLTTVSVNPMSVVLGRLSNVSGAGDLPDAVTDENGDSTPFFPSSVTVTDTQKESLAQAINQFCVVSQHLPADGSTTTSSSSSSSPHDSSFGLSFANDDIQPITSGSFDNPIEALAGDILHWASQAVDDVEQFLVKVENGVVHFFVQLGNDVYHFVVTCLSDVLHGIQFLLAKLKVAFETVVQWLGFIFSWSDIVATHQIMKSVISNYLTYQQTQISNFEGKLNDLSTQLQNEIGNLTGLTMTGNSGRTVGGPQPGTSHPAAHWGSHQLRSNLAGAHTSFTAPDLPTSTSGNGGSDLSDLLQTLFQAVKDEEAIVEATKDNLKTDILNNLQTLSVEQLITEVVGILAQGLVTSAVNVINAALKVFQELAATVIKSFEATLDIPVLSWMYKRYAKDDLSFLDLACLLAALPSTVIYKIVTDTTPFPAGDADTQALINAKDFQTVRSLLATPSPLNAAPKSVQLLHGPPLDNAAQRWNFVANVGAGFSALAVYMFTALKLATGDDAPSPVVNIGYAVCYVPYCAPDLGIDTPDSWYAEANELITCVAFIKNAFDTCTAKWSQAGLQDLAGYAAVSPYIDVAISAAWMVPTIASVVHDHSPGGVVGFVGNVSFNLTAFYSMAFTITYGKDPTLVTSAITAALTLDSILLYGAAMTTTAFVVGFSSNEWTKAQPALE